MTNALEAVYAAVSRSVADAMPGTVFHEGRYAITTYDAEAYRDAQLVLRDVVLGQVNAASGALVDAITEDIRALVLP